MKFENTHVYNLVNAIYHARNALESWDQSDSDLINEILGEKDLKLAQKLIRANSSERKFMRQILVSVDITAPMYWFSEFDTYKVSTVANSTSKMHKLATTPITLDCFETDDMDQKWLDKTGIEASCDTWVSDNIIYFLETLRLQYLKTKDKRYWKELIRWLPESWLQTRTITMNYENIFSICQQRRFYKLNEWSGIDDSTKLNFIAWARTLPYAQELIFIDELEDNNTKE